MKRFSVRSWAQGASLLAFGLLSAGCCAGLIKKPTPESFSGAYMTNWGVCSLTQSGSSVTGSCARGTTMSCAAIGKVLSCGWREGQGAGKAVLTKQGDGKLTGTWGNGASATNGGPWTFTPK